MTKSILNFSPVLQAVWTAAYQAVIQGEHMALADSAISLLPNMNELANRAEEHAWEAVRRANGGEVPGTQEEPLVVTHRDALLWFADEGHYEGTHKRGYGFVDACGLAKARRALGLPCDREDGTLMPLEEALALDSNCKAPVVIGPQEPTSDDMVETLAPIVAEAHYGAEWANIKEDAPRLEAVLNNARLGVDDPKSLYVSIGLSRCASVALASWKAARAWGKK